MLCKKGLARISIRYVHTEPSTGRHFAQNQWQLDTTLMASELSCSCIYKSSSVFSQWFSPPLLSTRSIFFNNQRMKTLFLFAILFLPLVLGYQCYLDTVGVKNDEVWSVEQFRLFPCGPDKVLRSCFAKRRSFKNRFSPRASSHCLRPKTHVHFSPA